MATITMQGLTPTISVRVPDTIDLNEMAHIYPSIKQKQGDPAKRQTVLLRPDVFDVQPHQVDIYLTQEETLTLTPGSAEIQLNWTYATGQRGATRPKVISVLENHILEVLE